MQTTPPDPDVGEVGPASDDGANDRAVDAHAAIEPPRPEAEPPASDAEELYVDGVRMTLQPSTCTFTAAFLDHELGHRFEFPGACHFAPGPDGQPWIVPTDHGKAVLVEGSTPVDGDQCDTALQIVVVTERGPALSRQVQRVSGCGPGPWDEMMYHVLASDRVALDAKP